MKWKTYRDNQRKEKPLFKMVLLSVLLLFLAFVPSMYSNVFMGKHYGGTYTNVYNTATHWSESGLMNKYWMIWAVTWMTLAIFVFGMVFHINPFVMILIALFLTGVVSVISNVINFAVKTVSDAKDTIDNVENMTKQITENITINKKYKE